MSSLTHAVEEREKGQVPISIGTSLAIEAGCGIYPERPEEPPPFTRVKQVWINLRTLVRNLIACLPTDLKETVLPDDLWSIALEELSILPTAVEKGSYGQAKVVYYASDYDRLQQRFPGALLRQPKTPKQLFQQKLEDVTLKMMLEKNQHHHVELFDLEITGQHPASFIITHLPIDLLARYRFERLELLESHTGKVKGPGAWNSKLTNGKELSNVPFNRFTLQLFGDNGNMFSPQPILLRRKVLELAHQWSWTNVSSVEKIRDTISKVGEDHHRAQLLTLL